MLPAQPPNSRRISGVRKQTLRMWSWSGSRWFLKRSGNTMIVSYAMDPVTRIVIAPLLWEEEVEAVAGRARAARVEVEPERGFRARGDARRCLRCASRAEVVARPQHAPHDRPVCI